MSRIIIKEKHFHPAHTFDCGQCFRFLREDDGSYTGIAHKKVINVSMCDEGIVLKNAEKADIKNIWHTFFDLGRDYGVIKKRLSGDRYVKTAIEFGWGIRILRQEFFECLISFIISANNNIPRIRSIVEKLCEMYGEKIQYNGKTYHTFPDTTTLFGIEEGDLAPLRAGYRAKYIADAVKMINRGMAYDEIETMPIDMARKELCKISGVGPKVADCVLLFAFGNLEAFPTDVWVKKVMSQLYKVDEKSAAKKGAELFGNDAGIAQQYLFYWMREGEKNGTKI